MTIKHSLVRSLERVIADRGEEIKRLRAIIDKNAKVADLLDRTLTALEKELKVPLDDAEAEGNK